MRVDQWMTRLIVENLHNHKHYHKSVNCDIMTEFKWENGIQQQEKEIHDQSNLKRVAVNNFCTPETLRNYTLRHYIYTERYVWENKMQQQEKEIHAYSGLKRVAVQYLYSRDTQKLYFKAV